MRGVDGLDLDRENARLESASPLERLAFAVDRFGDKLLFTSSFGAGSGVLLHLWSEVARARPVIFIDTGFLFEETLRYRDALAAQLGLTITVLRPEVSRAAFMAEHPDIQARDPDFCCGKNKVAPLEPLKSKADAWVSGLRRDQSATRAGVPILLATEGEPLKVHPIATVTAPEVHEYLRTRGIPEHPLEARGYRSIGCEPCTRAVVDGEDERAGRWAGLEKTECGLHSRPLHLRKRGAA
ncbi:MAG TPA: phosphoadenylyl-sulfate reductase [Polyangiaceae bacterium]|jgi:phosphoadenosine phosphosulfate reductase